jgi:hypothetical protein
MSGIKCSIGITKKKIEGIIGKDTIKNLTDAECQSIVTLLNESYSQEFLLDEKNKDAIIEFINNHRKIAKEDKDTSSKPKIVFTDVSNPITRDSAKEDSRTLYIFTDNTNRTSGKTLIDPNSKYAKKYGKDKKYPSTTLAILRGLDNSLPISTQQFYDPKNGKTWEAGRWNKEDFEKFKKTIDEEFEAIKEALNSGKYDRVMLPPIESLFHEKSLPAKGKKGDKTSISDISKERVPELYEYLKSKYEEVFNELEEEKEGNKEETKNTTSVTRIISGGQTGVDTIGLQVAKGLGIETGGKAPKGFLREDGVDKEDIESYGLEEITDEEQEEYTNGTGKKDPYTGRTDLNVKNSDGTVYFNYGKDSAGLIATRRSAEEHKKPFLVNPTAEELRQWIKKNNIKTLNVAGNRGSKLSKDNNVAKTLRNALTGNINKTDYSKEKKKETERKKAEVRESLKAERPISEEDAIKNDNIVKDILDITFPNVTERLAAISFIVDYFSIQLDNTIKQLKEDLSYEAYCRETYGDKAYESLVNGVTRGTEAQQRLFVLGLTLNADKGPVPIQIFNNIKDIIDDFKAAKGDEDAIRELVYDYYLEKVPIDNNGNYELRIRTDTLLGESFSWEMNQKGLDDTDVRDIKKIRDNAISRVQKLTDYFSTYFKDEAVFDALVKEAVFDIEFNENLRLDTRGNVVENTQEREDKENDVENEKENPNKEGYMIKYMLTDPIDTISVKLKNKLAHLYKMNFNTNRDNNIEFLFNSLGLRVKLNPMIAYYTLLNEFQTISSEDELDEMFEAAVLKYPWMQSIKDNVVFNPEVPQEFDLDFRKEFFRACKSFAPFAMVTNKGTIAYLNRDNQSSTFLDMVTTAYEGHQILGPNSIYNADGTRNSNNVGNMHKLVAAPGTEESREKDAIIKNHPLYFVNNVLTKKNSSIYDLTRALQLLRGEFPDGKGEFRKISLEALLNNLGINTSNMNLESLIPNIEALELDEKGNIILKDGKPVFAQDFIDEALDNGFKEDEIIDYFNTLFTTKMRSNISNILTRANIITAPSKGYQANDNLVTKFQTSYLSIGNSLTLANEAYSQTSFRFSGNSRFSYVAYNMITRTVNTLNKTDTEEGIMRGTQFLDDNYGNFDFFRNQNTKEWYNTWLKQLYEPGDAGDYSIRKNFKILYVLGFGGNSEKDTFGKISKETLIDNHILAFLNESKDEHGNSYGYYRNALFSDTDASVLVKHIRYKGENYKQEITEKLALVLKQEIERIIALRNNKKGIEIDNYNTGKNNGLKFNFFPALNDRLDEIIDYYQSLSKASSYTFGTQSTEYLTSLVESVLIPKATEFLNSFDDRRRSILYEKIKNLNNKLEEEDSNEKNIDDLFGNEETEDVKENSDKEEEELNEILLNFFYNDYFAQSQIIQMFGGDLAYYKNFRDFIKRNKQAYAAGDRLYGMKTDEHGHNTEKLTERCIYLKDKIELSNTYDSIKEILKSNVGVSNLTRSMILGALEKFRGINATDGQSFRTPASMKKILEAMGGKWTEDMQEAYDRMTREQRLDMKDFYTIWNNIKPFVYSHETVKIGNRTEKVPVQHKNSEYMMTAFYSLIGSVLSKSPQLVALQEFMQDNNIDVIHFESVVKVGGYGQVNLNYDKERFDALKDSNDNIKVGNELIKATDYNTFIKNLKQAIVDEKITQKEYNKAIEDIDFEDSEDGIDRCYAQLEEEFGAHDENGEVVFDEDENLVLNEEKLHTIPLSDYMVVQPSGDHLTEDDLMAIFGSQLRNILPADLPSDFSIDVKFGKDTKTLNREEYIELYNTIIVDQLLDSFSKVNDEFSTVKKLQKALLNKIHNNPKYGPEVEEALELNEDETGFKIPFNNPNLKNKIEELLLSTFKNAIQKQKINGGNIILVSNFGLSKDLHTVYKVDKKGKKSIDYIQCYMPAYKRSLIQDLLVPRKDSAGEEYWEVDYNKIKGNEDLLDIIGYRIPTENKYSIFKLRIKGFLPISAGTAIMLPSDIVSMSGTDFDIDKLFLMIKNFRRVITGRKYRESFDKYLQKKGIDNNDTSIEEVYKAINRGLTEEELNSYLESNEIFADYHNFIGNNLVTKPKYYAYSPSYNKGMSISDLSLQKGKSKAIRKKIRDNMLIDLIAGGLTSNAGSQSSFIPGSYDNVKQASRQQKILHNREALKKLYDKHKDEIEKSSLFEVLNKYGMNEDSTVEDGIDALDNFYDENATVDDPLSIIDYANNHRNLMDGNDLIGMFAVNSSSHYKFQFINKNEGLKLRDSVQFKITLPGEKKPKIVNTIDSVVSPLTGIKIGDICAEFQAASPDNGKDPVLGDLGCNSLTIGRVEFLIRIGCDPQTIGYLNTCDDLISAIRTQVSVNKDLYEETESWQDFDGKISDIVDLIAKYRLNGTINEENLSYAARFLGWMDNIQRLSALLQESSVISRCDSPNGALAISTEEVTQQMIKAKEFMNKVTVRENGVLKANPFSPILGFENFIDIDLDAIYEEEGTRAAILKSSVPRVQAFYTLGIRSAYTIAGRHNLLPQLSRSVENAVETLRNYTNNTLTRTRDVKELRRFYNELVMYLMSDRDSRFGSEEGKDIMDKRNYYIHDFPAKYYQFLNAKDKNGKFKHLNVKQMTLIQCMRVSAKSGITFTNVGKVSSKSRKYFSNELKQLLTSEDPEVVKFAEDLFQYSYYANGLNFGHSNFGIFFTNAFYENMPRYLDVLKKKNTRLTEDLGEFDYYMKNYIKQFLMNNPKYAYRLSRSKLKGLKFEKEGNKVIMYPKNKNALKKLKSRDGVNAVPMVMIQKDKGFGGMYVLTIEPTSSRLIYVKVTYNGKATPFYDSEKVIYSENKDNMIDFSKMKDYGDPSEVNNILKEKETKKNKKTKEDEKLQKAESTIDDDVEDALSQAELDDVEKSVPKEVDEMDNDDKAFEYPGEDAEDLASEDPAIDRMEREDLVDQSREVEELEKQNMKTPDEAPEGTIDDYQGPTENSENKMCEKNG